MSSKIRVFISSTMRDLANERRAVAGRIADFNFEPVNAEGWLPDGRTSWARIERELASSHLFVLILGERYGWIPEEGPGGGRGLSVTEMETEAAIAQAMPILAFVKRLGYGSDADSEDARRRDDFRRRVRSWMKGVLTADFELADDLAEKVGVALVGLISESYLSVAVAERARRASEPEPAPATAGPVDLAPNLVRAVSSSRPVLLAGAGVSLKAGYPSARALVELLHQELARRGLSSAESMIRSSFPDLADGFVSIYGRDALESIVVRALNVPQHVPPTPAHRNAVRLFSRIVTTNFDRLFEQAAEEQGIEYRVVVSDADLEKATDALRIIKLDGTISRPGSLVITTGDAFRLRSTKPRLYRHVGKLLRDELLVVVGHSLRDINIKTLMYGRSSENGFFVAPDLCGFDMLRIRNRGLEPVIADASDFFEALARHLDR